MMNIGGIYTDPFHSETSDNSSNIFGYEAPWYGGIRVCGRTSPDSKEFVCIGNDDGFHFWTLEGKFTGDDDDSAVEMDFTPKAPGVGLLQCSYQPGALSFLNDNKEVANTWSRLTPTTDFALTEQTKHDAFNNVNGLYVDLKVFQPGSYAGIRLVSDRLGKFIGKDISVVGTDDGTEFWALKGGSFDKQSSKGDSKLTVGGFTGGSIHNGTITFEDGTVWTKMAVGPCDLHKLPKENA